MRTLARDGAWSLDGIRRMVDAAVTMAGAAARRTTFNRVPMSSGNGLSRI
jgi:hypothetical protein